METVQIEIYTLDELNDAAKEKAREWYRRNFDFSWNTESRESIKTFCEHFGVKLKQWQVAPYSTPHFSTDAENSHFRGLKLHDVKRDAMPTGYYLDAVLWETFYDRFKETGTAKNAFEDALYHGFIAWRDDMEYQLSDESVDEMMICNEYKFTESGKFWS